MSVIQSLPLWFTFGPSISFVSMKIDLLLSLAATLTVDSTKLMSHTVPLGSIFFPSIVDIAMAHILHHCYRHICITLLQTWCMSDDSLQSCRSFQDKVKVFNSMISQQQLCMSENKDCNSCKQLGELQWFGFHQTIGWWLWWLACPDYPHENCLADQHTRTHQWFVQEEPANDTYVLIIQTSFFHKPRVLMKLRVKLALERACWKAFVVSDWNALTTATFSSIRELTVELFPTPPFPITSATFCYRSLRRMLISTVCIAIGNCCNLVHSRTCCWVAVVVAITFVLIIFTQLNFRGSSSFKRFQFSSSTKLCAINPNPNWRSSLQRPLSLSLSLWEFAACCKFLLLVGVVVAITFVLIVLHNWVSEKAAAREDFSSFVQRSSAP
jgi:hypothetical protein